MSRKRAHVSSSDSDDNVANRSLVSTDSEISNIEVETDETISESSSDIPISDPEKFPDGYDKDCIGDDDDRQKLNDMPEIERESELYRRMELREELQTKAKIQKKLKRKRKQRRRKRRELQLQKKRAKGMKLSDDSDDSDIIKKKKVAPKRAQVSSSSSSSEADSDSSYEGALTTEQKKKKARTKALKNLKKSQKKKTKKLEAQKLHKKQLDVDEEFGTSSTESKKSSSDEGELSASDHDDPDDRAVQNADEINIAKLSRFRCEQWCHNPWFRDLICGMYVRVGLGINKETGRETYRCAKILSTLTTLKHYELGNTRTNLAANVQIGTKEKGYRLNYLSNQPISESEFYYYKSQCEKEQISLPNYKKLKAKAQEIEDYKKKELSAAEFDKMIKTKKAFQLKPTSFARDKSELKMAIRAAEENSRPVEAQRMREKLARLENESIQRDETRVSELKNIEKINKAVENHNKQGIQAVRAANEKHRLSTTANPFSRRRTLPIMSTSKKDNQRVSEQLGKRYLAQVDTSYEQGRVFQIFCIKFLTYT